MFALSLSIHAVLSKGSLSGIPDEVRDVLREFAMLANEATLALQQALLLESRALATNDGDDYAERATMRQRLTDDLASSALSYRDQLVVTYARVAAEYAVVAGQVAASLIAGDQPRVPTGEVVRPSRVLTDLADILPLVQVFSDVVDDDTIADQNVELRRTYADLTSVIARHVTDANPSQYDDPRAAASRASTDTDLVVEFPAALHGYAAATTWAIATMHGGLGHD